MPHFSTILTTGAFNVLEAKVVAEPNDPNELLLLIRDWFRLLANGDFTSASAMIDEPNSYGIEWTPEYIRYALDLAFPPGCRFRVANPGGLFFTDPDSAIGTFHADVVVMRNAIGYSVYHDVPLNGIWSDLTAQFEFLRRRNGLAVVLHDLHVM